MNVLGKLLDSLVRARLSAWVRGGFAAGIIALAFYILSHHLNAFDRGDIVRALANLSRKALFECGALTCLSFVALGTYDMAAARTIAGRRISPGRAWLAGAVANPISNTLGFHVFTGTAVRYRILSRSGLTRPEVASVTALSWTALAFAFATTFSLAVTTSAQATLWQRTSALGVLGLALLCTKWLGTGKTIVLGKYTFRFPSRRLALAQMGLGAIEMASAIGALYVLMPLETDVSFPAFSALYIGAVLLGVVSHSPGGIGIFEATMLTLMVQRDGSRVVAALLAYRLIYNFAPFLLASLVLAVDELSAVLSSKAGSA